MNKAISNQDSPRKRIVITYGTFDVLHQGHINLLRRAKELGDWLIVGVTTDNFDLERGKLNTRDSVMKRVQAVKDTGYADEVIIEEYKGQKIDDIQKYNVDVFAIGSDWEGYFDYLKEYCEVVYLPRTQGISSTMLRESQISVRIGVIGTGSIARRFVPEASFVSGNEISAAYNPDTEACRDFCRTFGIGTAASSLEELLANCDAVYVASPHYTHFEYAKAALEAGKDVFCETPFVLHLAEAKELYAIAEAKRRTLMVAHKTAYCPAFRHLVTMLKSGVIGKIVDINASVTTLTDERSVKLDHNRFGGSMNENACFPLLPILKLLGQDVRNINFYSIMKNDVDMYTKAVFRYDNATASFQVGLGAKTEGNMVISGTKGYIYVPAPWWKTDYFEQRFEDQNLNRKCFFPFMGEGLRYEIREFISHILNPDQSLYLLTKEEILKMTQIQEDYINGVNVYKLS
ncbi:MAG: Gfo/Idh/MocA family oxidoreductase [Bacteroidales bacterium]|nr:Gfo/Idh/MocA family oxidoreductase [Bacteroidales bacterium]MCI6045920.1 Gfo/Idh/MocA family oxidoreductase [Alistipes sp.]MDY5198753.1 Gfo/Idh/MocA family oxidoreductase [Candidatus Cryptobacteroides sp.]CCX51984.1 glycerol-3-phosphate cytidyltransferase [Alistipes sp. CAG:514]